MIMFRVERATDHSSSADLNNIVADADFCAHLPEFGRNRLQPIGFLVAQPLHSSNFGGPLGETSQDLERWDEVRVVDRIEHKGFQLASLDLKGLTYVPDFQTHSVDDFQEDCVGLQ